MRQLYSVIQAELKQLCAWFKLEGLVIYMDRWHLESLDY
jgi:hypothetical protein